MTWPQYLRQARLSLGFTQKQWAARWSVHWTTVARWESGKQTMPAVVTWWLANLDGLGYQGGKSKSKESES